MRLLITVAMISFVNVYGAEATYSDVPVKNMPDEAPLPIYKPEQSSTPSASSSYDNSPSATTGSSSASYGKLKIPPFTTRLGFGGVEHNELPNSSGGFSFNLSSEFRFHEPYSIIPRVQYSREKAFLGLRERGGLKRTGSNFESPLDTKFEEWTFGLNFGMELTPQDGFFHLIPAIGPFYRTAKLEETEVSLKDRPAFTGSQLRARGFGVNLNLVTAFDIYDRYGFFVAGNWDVILDTTQRYSLQESEKIDGNSSRPGFNARDAESMEKNFLSWQLGFQARF